MAKTTFQLDIPAAGRVILQDLAAEAVRQSAGAMLDRANRIGNALSSEQPGFNLKTRTGTIKKGTRFIATISANETADPHQAYMARLALVKSKDAGRL